MSMIDIEKLPFPTLFIFDELCKGNISILTLENKKFLNDLALVLLNSEDIIWDQPTIDNLKYLIMICNLLYNRTDMIVLPIEDGVYDLLLEKYKTFDPEFQVGSVVVQFQDQIEKELLSAGVRKAINPLKFIKPIEKDETRQYFEQQIKRYDSNQGRYTSREIFAVNPLKFNDNQYISKRIHNTKHNHPQLVGTLDKCKFVLDADAIERDVYKDPNVKILERDFFIEHIKNGIITEDQELEIVIELKYDGVSVEADCTNVVESARTRGDTGIGEAADITPILKGYRFPRNTVLPYTEVGVKFEAIMTKHDLEAFNKAKNYNYANCRTAIIGLFGSSDAYKYRDYITLIPLAIDRDNVPEIKDRMTEIEFMNTLYRTKGEPLRYCYIRGNYRTCLYLIKKFAEEAEYARNYLNFAFDGIVISYLDEGIRERLGRENFINKYSMAVKFNPDEKLTTFLGYTFEVGQAGNICPMIHYAPVEFFGTIHPKSTGSSLDRFKKLALKPGDIIKVSYNNDVMPYVHKFECEQNRNNPNSLCEFPEVCPVCGTKLIISESGKSALCPNIGCDGRRIARLTNMLQKLNMKGFGESTVMQLNVNNLSGMMEWCAKRFELADLLGPTNADNFIAAMTELLTKPTEDYNLIGSLGFSNIGPRKWKLIFKEYTLGEFIEAMNIDPDKVFSTIRNIKNLGESTAKTIIDEYKYFEQDMMLFVEHANVIDSKNTSTKKEIRFTGCRNKQLEEQLNSMGYDANGGSVTKSTDILIVPYKGFSSTKTAKVSENTMVIAMDDFLENMDKYL